MLPALSLDGIIHVRIIPGSFDGPAFSSFLRSLVLVMNPWPGKNSVLILDNSSIHHVQEVEDIASSRSACLIAQHPCHTDQSPLNSGIRIIYLPGYSPDLNPIEEAFACYKAHIRRCGTQYRSVAQLGSRSTIMSFLHQAIEVLTPRKALGWFRHSGYV